MRRGLTLMETLASLALLSLIAIACAEWIAVASRVNTIAEHDSSLALPIEAVFVQLQDDLHCGEFPSDDLHPAVQPNEVTISRLVGDRVGLHQYRLMDDGRLVLRIQWVESASPAVVRPLLIGARGFACHYNSENRRLEVRIVDASGVEHRRRLRVP